MENTGCNELPVPRSKQNPGNFGSLQHTRSLSASNPRSEMSWTPTPFVQREQQWQQVRQHQRQYTAGYQHARCPSTGGHLSSRQGLDVSRLAFGSILREFTRTPATSPAMGNILNRFLEYNSGIPRRNHNVRAFLSPVSFAAILTIPFVAQCQR